MCKAPRVRLLTMELWCSRLPSLPQMSGRGSFLKNQEGLIRANNVLPRRLFADRKRRILHVTTCRGVQAVHALTTIFKIIALHIKLRLNAD
jgi:hypothetical protein